MMTKTTPTRVLVVDDSPVARELLISILQMAPGLQVVGAARNGVEAVRLAKRLKPDVITMDVYMPEMDGLEAARQIMIEAPCPIVVVSNGLDQKENNLTFNALKVGALSVVRKLTIDDTTEAYAALATHVKLMSEVKVVRRWDTSLKQAGEPRLSTNPAAAIQNHNPVSRTPAGSGGIQLIAIASSTGGPGTLAEILSKLPSDFAVPILIVQHITPGFGKGLADWLNRLTTLEVRPARHGDELKAGRVLIAPDGCHMVVNNWGLVALTKEAPHHGLRPAADYLFRSVAQVYGATAMGIILTGMGNDGAAGLQMMHDMGAHTIAQDKESCVVFGMPAAAIELGAAKQVLPAAKIAGAVLAFVGQQKDRVEI
jgi:two-component system chemotaxis response regulator CheB